MKPVLGIMADDLTGATDLASTLVNEGMRVTQVNSVPSHDIDLGGAEAIVVAQKTRTTPVDEAVADTLNAFHWLYDQGVERFFFKYCSTFDSTSDGNIGPVADALSNATGAGMSVVCPAFPTNGRTIRDGQLYVGDDLLENSSMKDHPLTPMRDSDIARLMDRQSKSTTGKVLLDQVRCGPDFVRERLSALQASGHRYAVTDVVDDEDLRILGAAIWDMPLITGGSGIALGLPDMYRAAGLIGSDTQITPPSISGRRVVLSGSCSAATRGQIAAVPKDWPIRKLNPFEEGGEGAAIEAALMWASMQSDETPIVFYTSADPDEVAAIQETYGRDQSGAAMERTLAGIAVGMADMGATGFVVAGGETSGAVVGALGVTALRIGPEIDPGVPWTEGVDGRPVALALKSGNFGATDFFEKAFRQLG